MNWKPETRAKYYAAKADLVARTRYYIQFSYWNPETRTHDKGVWPLLFKSYDDAMAHTTACNPFQNTAAMTRGPRRGRIKSFSVEKVILRHAISP